MSYLQSTKQTQNLVFLSFRHWTWFRRNLLFVAVGGQDCASHFVSTIPVKANSPLGSSARTCHTSSSTWLRSEGHPAAMPEAALARAGGGQSSFWGWASKDVPEILEEIGNFGRDGRIGPLKHFRRFCWQSLQAGAKAAANCEPSCRVSIILIKYILL